MLVSSPPSIARTVTEPPGALSADAPWAGSGPARRESCAGRLHADHSRIRSFTGKLSIDYRLSSIRPVMIIWAFGARQAAQFSGVPR
jgi:hypothetical protein